MRLHKLELENWSCHGRLSLDLTNGLQIEGRNGSGKTSILEAIRFVFSESALGYKNRVRNGERSARVNLSFERDGNSYLIEKELFVDKPSAARLLCNDVVLGDNPTGVYKAMQRVFDENVFDKLLYIPQGGLTSIVESLSRKDGRKELDSLFGLERFDRVYRDSADDIKECRIRLDVTLEQLARHPADAMTRYSGELRGLEVEWKALEADVKKACGEITVLDAGIGRADARLLDIEGVKRKRDVLLEELKALELELARLKAEEDGVRQRLDALSKTAENTSRLTEKESELRKYAEIRELLAKLGRLKDREAALNINRDQERLTALEGELSQKQEAERKYSEAEAGLKEAEAAKAAVEHELRQNEHRARELEGLEGMAKCPRCGQLLTPEHVKNERLLNGGEAGKLKAGLAGVGERLSLLKGPFGQLKERLMQLEKACAEATYLKGEVGRKTEEAKALGEAAAYLGVKLREAGHMGETPDAVEERSSEYNKVVGELGLLKEELKQKSQLEERQKKLAGDLKAKNAQGMEKNETLSQLHYSEDEHNALRKTKEDLTKKKYAAENEADKKKYLMGELKSKMDEEARRLDEYGKLKSSKDVHEKEMKLLTQAREVFHTDKGIQKYLRDRYISQLNSLLSYYFKRINENSKYLEIAFDKNYEIRVKTTGGQMSIDQLSGGEKIQLAIALRIALTEMLSNTRLLILDEPFGSLDKNHREILGETLTKIASNGQLIVVTHVHVDSLQLERLELEGY